MKKKNQQSVLAVKVYLTLLQSKKPLTVAQIAERTCLDVGEVYKALSLLTCNRDVSVNATQKQVDMIMTYMKYMADGISIFGAVPKMPELKYYAV